MPDNYLHIHDNSFRLYNKGLSNNNQAKIYADSLEKFARNVGDTRAIVLAEFLRICYYREILQDEAKWMQSLMKMRQLAKELDDERDFYFTYSHEITNYANKNNWDKAIAVAEAMTQEAKAANSNFGLWQSYHSLSELYKKMNAKKRAREYAYKALEVLPNVYPPVSPASDYLTLAKLEEKNADRKKYAEYSLQTSIKWDDSIAAYKEMANIYKRQNDTASYLKLYNELMAPANKKRIGTNSLISLESGHYVFLKQYDKALAFMEACKEHYPTDIYLYNRSIYLSLLKRYKEAFYTRLQYDEVSNHKEYAKYHAEAHRVGLGASNYQLQKEAALQELQRQQEESELSKIETMRTEAMLKMAAAQNKQRQAQALAGRDSANNRNLQLENKRKALEAQKSRDAYEHALLEQRLEEQRNNSLILRTRMLVFGGIGLLFLFLLGIVAYISYIQRREHRKKQQLNHELSLAITASRNASKKKDLFLQNMSHELRTPLNAVIGLSQILTSGVPVSDEEKMEYGHDINNNVRMLQMLIDDIINLSAIEQGTYSIVLQPCNIASICQDAMAIAQYRVPNGVSLVFQNELPENFECVIDPKRAQQVLVNYLTNACKHTSEGSITVRATINETPGFLSFSVTDTGTGIPADQAHNIFERFTKLNDFVQGTGLGLNICYTIATMLRGRVWLDTSYTGGARFLFEVPLDLQATATASDDAD